MEQFKGYIVTDGKRPIEKYKDRDDFKTYDQIKNLPEYAGVIQDGYVLIDIDDAEQSKRYIRMVNDLDIKTKIYKTNKGIHSYFKVNDRLTTAKTKTFLVNGFNVDIKLGDRNGIAILKLDDKERECILDNGIGILPYYLSPIDKHLNFLGKENGDGRNQGLFNYILTLQSEGYTKEEAREIIRIINAYVMKDPLPDRELETVLRDDAFNKPAFFIKNKFQFDTFSKYLISEHNIIKINNQLHLYDNGIYRNDIKAIENRMITHISNLRHAQRSEVLKYINVYIQEDTKVSDARYIAFANGIYDIVEDVLKPFSDDYVLTNRIDFNYNPKAYDKLADKTLSKMACGDDSIRDLMEEMIGYTFYRRNELGKAFILTGDKSNGKSTFLSMLQNLLGDNNTSSLDLKELGDRFKTVALMNKLANIGDDIGDNFIGDTEVFKKAVTGERLNVERKGEDVFEFNNYSKLIFSANNIPRIKDNTGAILRRLIIIPFNATFSPDDPDFDPFIKYKLLTDEVMEYLIQLGIRGLRRVLYNNKFTESEQVKDELDKYHESINPILTFVKEYGLDSIIDRTSREVYLMYSEFCAFSNLLPLSRIQFTTQLNKQFKLETIPTRVDGKVIRVFKEQ